MVVTVNLQCKGMIMKICIAFHQCMDLGGIINHTEQLIGGLKDLGHTVHLKELAYNNRVHDVRKDGHFEIGPSGIPFNQGKGWNFKYRDRMAYKTTADLRSCVQVLNGYDMVVWTVPVPPKNKHHLGNNNWPDLYDLNENVKQVAFIHDGNARSNSLHLYRVVDHLSGLACVHECALNGANFLPIPRALILNPQENPIREVQDWRNKREGFVNMQTFKAWKRVHELIEAIAYMPDRHPEELREVAGRGIEYQYMTSEDKCKPEYFHDQSDEWFSSMKIWEAALGNGMNYHDYWGTQEVDEMLNSARVLVDPSWSNKYSAIGGHWNRVAVDAMIRGAVPVANKLGMGTSLFKPGAHYIDLSPARDPQDYADIVMAAGKMESKEAATYREYALNILPFFERKAVAQRLVDLAFGNIETEVGTEDRHLKKKYEDLMFNHYGALV